MRKLALLIVIVVTIFSLHRSALAQVQELPNVPIVTGGWQENSGPILTARSSTTSRWGTGTPVILIHGSGGTALNWMPNGLGPSLAKTNRVLAIDMRGHGQTVGPTASGSSARRTWISMCSRSWTRWGSSGRTSAASRWADRSPASSWPARRSGSSPRTSADRACAKTEGSEFAKMIPPDPKGTAPLDAEARKRYQARQEAEAAKAGVATGEGDAAQLSSQPVPAAVPRPPLDLTKIEFPILAVVGEFDQPYTRTHRLWREAPNFQRVILRNRGHLSSYMAGLAPELYRDSLTNFIVRNNPKR